MERSALRKNVTVLAATVAVMLTARLMWERLLPTYYADLGAQESQIAQAFSLVAVALALFQLVGGLLADRVGRKPVAVLPVFGAVIATAWMAQAQHWRGLLFSHLAFSVVASLQSPGFTSLLAESVPLRERGRAFSTVTIGARFASTLGPALGAALLIRTTMPMLLWVTVIVGVGVSFARLLMLRETIGTVEQSTSSRRLWGESDRRLVAGFLLVGTLYTLFVNLLHGGPFIALHARQALHLDNVQINLLFAGGDGLAALTAPLVGRLGDRVGHRRMLAAGVLASAGGLLAWATLAQSKWLATVFFVLAMAAASASQIAYSALLAGVVEGRRRGAFIGMMGTITGLLGAPAAYLGAQLRAWGGGGSSFWAALGLAGLLVAALALGSRRAR